MLFCPRCGNLLLVEDAAGTMRFFCQTCPYVHGLRETVTKRVPTGKPKEEDDVLGGKAMFANADTRKVTCEACGNEEAYCREMATRSADEPVTLFFRCVKCAHSWNLHH
uniref:DNA-directed RNA polymerase subunit n=1 Tax=Bicosoecida sp. CB-2014 TaxID=1486930 RepID=A0A7S1G779_9STRA|mmetsp:Transcript_18688/g.66022  ORF Transcript_18688/g.66022 Transcript_18688/m.66022 type:complete len:109 (+) Transcript_18688:351-677(+)